MAEDYAAIFEEETTELLEELESTMLELEKNPDDLNIVGRIFRNVHTIKGAGAMFGFDVIADFTHHLESLLDKVRNNRVATSKELISLILASRDHIASLLAAATGARDAVPAEQGEELVQKLKDMSGGGTPTPTQLDIATETSDTPDSLPQAPSPLAENTPQNHYRIMFRPKADFFKTGGDVQAIIDDLGTLGELSITGQSNGTDKQNAAGEIKAFWDILLHCPADENTVRDAFIFAENSSEINITNLGPEHDNIFPEHQKLGDILVERGEISKTQLENSLTAQKPLGKILVEKKITTHEKINSALKEQKVLTCKRQAKNKKLDSLRVASDKLDNLINLVGEMVVTQARLTEVTNELHNAELLEPVENIERLTAELRDAVLDIRMLPIGSTFSKFKRLIRDLSDELGKQVDLVMEGAETELDKSIMDQLSDPLVHLIRNSLDHGIETPDERLAMGKPARGRITLSANHSGTHVIIQVIDDGRGIDVEKIRAKAIEMGIIASEAELSEAEVFNLILGAGVSTASQVTKVSGRGVGMDVVKTAIEGRLKGTIHIESAKDAGSTITISLPLTLAIIDGLLVRTGTTHFVLPLTQVEECVELTGETIAKFHGRHVFPVRETLIPYILLRDFFEIQDEPPEVQQMVIVNINGVQIGLVVDDIIGGHQTVLKSLGWVYRNVEGVSGATILGSGEVALIVDVANLVKEAKIDENAA